MQRAEALLKIIHERGKRGIPLERLYRHLFNLELYLRAYGKIYRNDGAMTPGASTETVDGMSLGKIQAIVERCGMSATGGPRCGAPTSTRRIRRRSVRWGCRRGATGPEEVRSRISHRHAY
jgi:hypothetical protein